MSPMVQYLYNGMLVGITIYGDRRVGFPLGTEPRFANRAFAYVNSRSCNSAVFCSLPSRYSFIPETIRLIRQENRATRTPSKSDRTVPTCLMPLPTPFSRQSRSKRETGMEGNGGALRFSAFTTELRLFNYFYESCFNYFTNLQLRAHHPRGSRRRRR